MLTDFMNCETAVLWRNKVYNKCRVHYGTHLLLICRIKTSTKTYCDHLVKIIPSIFTNGRLYNRMTLIG